MSQDDMHVVMCKIIAYLYSCMKNGTDPDLKQIRHDGALGINYRYWAHIMRTLDDRGYITGITVYDALESDGVIVNLNNPMATLEGVEYMKENSAMRKAAKYLLDNAATITKGAASALMMIPM